MIDLKNYSARMMHRFFSNQLRVTCLIAVFAVLVSVFAYNMQKSVALVVDGKPTKLSTYKTTVKDVLKSADIGVDKRDLVIPTLETKVTNNMTIRIKRAVPVSLVLSGKQKKIYTTEDTVGNLLKTQGIVLSRDDVVSPTLQSAVKKGMKVSVTRFAETTVTITKDIDYRVLSKSDRNLPKGKVKVLKSGSDGVKLASYKVLFKDGKEIGRYLINEIIKKAPINKIVAVGALSWFTPNNGSRKVYFTKQLRVKATSYTADYKCTGKRPGDRGFGITATGSKVKRRINGYSTVAVDSSVIPLGTKLYIEGYGFAIAEDIGGGVRGRHIDLYFEPGTREYKEWYSHRVNVYVLK